MSKSENKSTFRKWFNYITNALLVLIIATLFFPSWRVSFQAWFQGFFLDEVEFVMDGQETIPLTERNWELFDMEGNIYNFADFEGQPIFLSFWATWCPSCRTELPEIKKLKTAVDSDIKFISVTEENIDLVTKLGLNEDFDFLYSTQDFPAYFNITSYPTLVIVDSKMNIVYRLIGAGHLNNEKNISFLEGLLEK